MRTRYRIDDYQQSYFVLPSFEAMPALDEASLQAAMARARAGADIDPSVVLPRDRVLQRGDGSHHAAKIAS
jgi:phenylalanine-4-hydroxylase